MGGRATAIRAARAAVLAVAASALAGCAGLVWVVPETQGLSERNRAVLAYAGEASPVLVRVRGAPAAAAERIARLADGAVAGIPVTFSTDERAAARPALHLVLAFDAPRATTGRQACDPQAPLPPAGGGDSRLYAVFCDGGEPLAGAYGWVARAAGPDDPAMAELVRTTVAAAFPPPERDLDNDQRDPFPD